MLLFCTNLFCKLVLFIEKDLDKRMFLLAGNSLCSPSFCGVLLGVQLCHAYPPCLYLQLTCLEWSDNMLEHLELWIAVAFIQCHPPTHEHIYMLQLCMHLSRVVAYESFISLCYECMHALMDYSATLVVLPFVCVHESHPCTFDSVGCLQVFWLPLIV